MTDIEFDCPKCNHHLAVDETGSGKWVKCPECGGDIVIPLRLPTQTIRSTPTNYPPPIANSSPPLRKTSDWAVWSLVLGIISFAACCFLLGIPAIICGHIARSRIKKANGSLKGEGTALAGLILGYSSFISTLLLFGFMKAIEVANNIEETKVTILLLDTNVSSYKMMHGGKLPGSMNEILASFPMKELSKDAFGNDFVYFPNHADGTYKIFSTGPDGKIGTRDDISNTD